MSERDDIREPAPRAVVASRARTVASVTLPLLDADGVKHAQREADPLVGAMSAFSGLREGQEGMLSVTYQAHPHYKRLSAQAIRDFREGRAPQRQRGGRGKALAALPRFIAWLLRRVLWETRGGQGSAPTLARGATGSAPLTQLSDDQRDRLREAERKAADSAHYRVALDLAVAGDPWDKPSLVGVQRDVQEALRAALHSRHQQLCFDDVEPRAAVTGHLHPAGDDRLVLSAEELACIGHIPDDRSDSHSVEVVRNSVKEVRPRRIYTISDPRNPVENGTALIPVGAFDLGGDDERIVGFPSSELDKHCYFCGTTGAGKSELMQWLILGSVKDAARRAIVVLDPHGELIADTLYNIIAAAPERAGDVLLADLGDEEHPVAINPLDISRREQVDGVVGQVMEMVTSQLNVTEESAPRGVPLMRQALKALAEANLHLPAANKLTLLQVMPFFSDAEFRSLVMRHCTRDDVIAKFGDEGEYSTMSAKAQQEQAAVPIRVFGRLAESDAFASVFGASQNRLRWGDMVSERSIILVSAGGLGSNKALGEFVCQLALPGIIAASEQHGRQRSDLLGDDAPSGNEVGIRVFVDEAPAVIKEGATSVRKVLREMRKRDLGLTMTGQFLEQFDSALIQDVVVNTQTKFTLREPPKFAKTIVDAISPDGSVTPADVAALPNYAMYGNAQLDGGKHSGVFSCSTLPPGDRERTPERKQVVREIQQRSRAALCNGREDVQASLRGQTARMKVALAKAIAGETPQPAPSQELPTRSDRPLVPLTPAVSEPSSGMPSADIRPVSTGATSHEERLAALRAQARRELAGASPSDAGADEKDSTTPSPAERVSPPSETPAEVAAALSELDDLLSLPSAPLPPRRRAADDDAQG